VQLTAVFEENRGHLTAVARRILGSVHDAEDAVQQSWLKAAGADLGSIDNVPGWLTTLVARVCLDMLRQRRFHVPLDESISWDDRRDDVAGDVASALPLLMDLLSPGQRVAFVLHDVFGFPFADIAAAIGTTPAAAKQLASRARRAVRGAPAGPADRALAEAFLAASRDGDIPGLLQVLAPGVVRRVDTILVPSGVRTEVRGAGEVAEETRSFAERARAGAVVEFDGAPVIVLTAEGRVRIRIRLTFGVGEITGIDIRAVR
jgi:RNA polymerase sigma-70 factor (ECF subfamily)